jgi:Spy/CpxP family protein refolding chaperone
MQAPERASWQNPKVLTTLLLVFLSGALTGALSMRLGLHDRLHPPTASSGVWGTTESAAFMERCKRELGLSPQQAEQMAAILDDYKSYYDGVKEQLADVRATGRNRIMELLTEEQRKKFEKLTSDVLKQ